MRSSDIHGANPSFSMLFVCKANQCRSPLAEAVARRELARRGVEATVASAGLEAVAGQPVTEGTAMAAKKARLDVSHHRSRPVTADLIDSTTVILAMERDQVVDLVNVHGADLRRTFTVPELASIGRLKTNRRADGTLVDWLAWVSSQRAPMDVIAMPGNEIADPSGRPLRYFKATIELLERDIGSILDAVLAQVV